MALVPWSPLKNGFLSGKYRRGAEVTDSARTAFVGGPSEDEYVVIDAVAAVADELGTTSAAVSLAWLRARQGTVVPDRGRAAGGAPPGQPGRPGRDPHSRAAAPRWTRSRRRPELPGRCTARLRAMLQFAGATVDGEPSAVYPPLLQSAVRY